MIVGKAFAQDAVCRALLHSAVRGLISEAQCADLMARYAGAVLGIESAQA